jgi:hypothetical protein
MFTQTRFSFFAALAAAGFLASPALAADHREAPLIRFDPAADINDVYAFTSPEVSGNLVFAMTVNPFIEPGSATGSHFDPSVHYVFHIDSTGDAVADRRVLVYFTGDGQGAAQTVTAEILDPSGAVLASVSGNATAPSLAGTPPAFVENTSGALRLFAGQTDDPFFFDFVGFNRVLATGNLAEFTGLDTFAGFNVSTIVFEAPAADVTTGGATNLQVWGVTARQRYTVRRGQAGSLVVDRGAYVQIERMGNPAVATALIPSARKDEYNFAFPANDSAAFAGDIVASINSLTFNPAGGPNPNLGTLAAVALPDTLKFDTTGTGAYPFGRLPEDDVIDILLGLITNLNGDGSPVNEGVPANDVPLAGLPFPYFAAPHTVPDLVP